MTQPLPGISHRLPGPRRRPGWRGTAFLVLSIAVLIAACSDRNDPRALFGAERYAQSLAAATALAEQNDPAAANLVGLHYYLGAGVARDFAAAATWFERAARLGDPAAQRNLATLYLRGLGVRQNDFLAYAWFSESAKRGNARARDYLATMGDALTPSEIVRARRALAREIGQRPGQ